MLENILRDQCKLDPQKPVLVGVSGGPDSLCLMDILRRAGYPLIVAHFNHRLRPEAEQEADAVAGLARTLGLKFVTDSADVRAHALSQGLSLEEAARMLRYRFLFASAREHAAQAVAVGHTADDQVETVLMHFLRGAGLAGLKGMETRSLLPLFDPQIPLIRPLLGMWRGETEAYCRENDLQPHQDASNADQVYFRNRLRHTLIPELEKYNPRLKESLLRSAQALQGDYVALQEILDADWNKVFADQGKGWIAFQRPALVRLSTGIQRNLIRRAGEILRPASRDIGYQALDRAARWIDSPTGKQVDFVNGLYLLREQGTLYLVAYEADLPSAQFPQVAALRSLLMDTALELGNDWKLSAEEVDGDEALSQAARNADPFTAWLDVGQAQGDILVRKPRQGDRFQPLGMESGSIKLSDFFINEKLPRRARGKWPLVCSGEEIVWVVGYRLAHPFRVTEATKRAVRLTLRRS
ncbi:MAG: tRNA lysidine(34) synthetase TilS [Anaerolineales bacterium]|jgi:tRNA(Ile)-lysidine synthase